MSLAHMFCGRVGKATSVAMASLVISSPIWSTVSQPCLIRGSPFPRQLRLMMGRQLDRSVVEPTRILYNVVNSSSTSVAMTV